MKLTIKKEILNEKLNIVAKAISTKNIIPVLGGIKFELMQEGLFLTTSNDDIAIQTFIDKTNIDNIDEIGSIILPGKYFLEIIRKLDDEYISIETDGLKIMLSTKRGEYSLNGMNVNEFPNLKFDTQEKPIILKETILKNIILQTSFATSTQESRPVLTGINFKIEGNTLECTATDSYRLAKKIITLDEVQNTNINIVIPSKNLLELIKILNNDENSVELHIFSNNILIKSNETLFQSRLLNNSYPDTSKLVPNDFEVTIKVNLLEFYNTIDRVSLLTSEKDKNLINMDLQGNTIILSSSSQEIGKMEETIEIQKDKDVNMKIAYSSKYMIDALRALKCETIEIKLNSEVKPIIIKNVEDRNLIQLILPIKTF